MAAWSSVASNFPKGIFWAAEAERSGESGVLIGASDAEAGLGLQDARGGDADVVVLRERGMDELLKAWIVKEGPPFFVSE